MDEGRIVESGSHAELLAAGGLYQQLYDAQFAADEEDEWSVNQPASDVAIQAIPA
jgi:ATP-binding cassette, subfamily B, bacterial MsbA